MGDIWHVQNQKQVMDMHTVIATALLDQIHVCSLATLPRVGSWSNGDGGWVSGRRGHHREGVMPRYALSTAEQGDSAALVHDKRPHWSLTPEETR